MAEMPATTVAQQEKIGMGGWVNMVVQYQTHISLKLTTMIQCG